MATRRTYDVHVHREGKFWAIDVPGIGFTQASRLTAVEETAREAVALTAEVDEDTFDLNIDIVVPDDANDHVKQARALRAEAARVQAQAAFESALSAAVLKRDGRGLRVDPVEVETVLGRITRGIGDHPAWFDGVVQPVTVLHLDDDLVLAVAAGGADVTVQDRRVRPDAD